jgi:uncharacterized delta-60 repeat protein
MLALVTGLANLALASAAYSQPGQLDATFGGDGRVTTNVTAGGDFAADVVVQTDGKIVVAGGARWERDGRFALLRYNADGTLDTTFSGDGKVTTNFTPRLDAAWGLAIQSDGKIVVAGDAGLRSGDSRFAVARYNTDGTLDSTFGGDGKVTTQFTRADDPVAGIALQADGKIVVSGGAAWNTRHANFALARYNVDGALDASFGGDGKVTTDFTRRNDVVLDLALQPDGKIVAVGIAGSDGSNPNFAIARYEVGGTLDASFSGDGKVKTDFTAGYDQAEAVAVQPDGRLVVGGATAGLGGRFVVARYDVGGALDSTFNGGGLAATNFTRHDDFAFGLALQADGNIVLAGGSGWGGSNPEVALARYLGS